MLIRLPSSGSRGLGCGWQMNLQTNEASEIRYEIKSSDLQSGIKKMPKTAGIPACHSPGSKARKSVVSGLLEALARQAERLGQQSHDTALSRACRLMVAHGTATGPWRHPSPPRSAVAASPPQPDRSRCQLRASGSPAEPIGRSQPRGHGNLRAHGRAPERASRASLNARGTHLSGDGT